MTGKNIACSPLDPIFQNWREDLVRWAVDEPDRTRAYTGVALGAVGLSLIEALAKHFLGCPSPLNPPPPPGSAPHQLVAIANPRRTLG